jgi:hypothetical protein
MFLSKPITFDVAQIVYECSLKSEAKATLKLSFTIHT